MILFISGVNVKYCS